MSDVRVEDLRRKDVFMVRAFTSFDLPVPQSWQAMVWHKSMVVVVNLGGPHWSPLNVAHELRRDDLEHWATVRSNTRWCGLTAAEILVRLDEWLSARNG